MQLNQTFTIFIFINQKKINIKCTCIYVSDTLERYKLSIKDREIIIRTNRPGVVAKIIHKKTEWKIESGYISNAKSFMETLNTLRRTVEEMEKNKDIKPCATLTELKFPDQNT